MLRRPLVSRSVGWVGVKWCICKKRWCLPFNCGISRGGVKDIVFDRGLGTCSVVVRVCAFSVSVGLSVGGVGSMSIDPIGVTSSSSDSLLLVSESQDSVGEVWSVCVLSSTKSSKSFDKLSIAISK